MLQEGAERESKKIMLTIILTAIVSIAIWQLATWIFYLATEHEENTIVFACCLWAPLALAVNWIVKQIQLWKSRKYNIYQFFGKDKQWVYNFYITPKDAEKFKQCPKDEEPTEEYCIRLLREGKKFKNSVYKREILTIDKNGIVHSQAGFEHKYFEKYFK